MIKTVITACICTLFTLNARAQLEKKTWLVGGNGSFKSTNYTQVEPDNGTIHNINLSINPKIGYFLYNNLALGLSPVLEYEKYNTKNNGHFSNSEDISYGIGPFVRYYFLNNHKAYNLVSEINYQYQIFKSVFPDVPDKNYIQNFSFLAGPVIYFNESVGIELLMGYQSRRTEYQSQINTIKSFQTSIGLQIHLIK